MSVTSALEGGGDLAALSRGAARQVVSVVIAQLQKTLHARRGVVRALPFKAVRQLEHESRALTPPLLTCSSSMHSLHRTLWGMTGKQNCNHLTSRLHVLRNRQLLPHRAYHCKYSELEVDTIGLLISLNLQRERLAAQQKMYIDVDARTC